MRRAKDCEIATFKRVDWCAQQAFGQRHSPAINEVEISVTLGFHGLPSACGVSNSNRLELRAE
jgi:hypothetical protein